MVKKNSLDEIFKSPPKKIPPVDYSMLTPHQTEVMEGILAAIADGTRKIILKGSAGVGKTFLVNFLINKMNMTRGKSGTFAYITAPTNRAVSVLEAKAGESYPWWMQFSTIHKALYMKRIIDEKTGEIYFKPDYRPKYESPFRSGFIIVVDEASMLNSEILFYLEDDEYAHIPMIFLGDFKQLNPVKEKDSPVFLRPALSGQEVHLTTIDKKTLSHVIPEYKEFELTEIIRQAEGNPIIQLSNNLPRIGLMEDVLMEDDTGYSYTSDYERCVQEVIDNENHRYLAWTNEAVNKFNFVARQKLFFNPQKVELDEILIFAQPYNGSVNNYSNNSEIKVTKLEIKEGKFQALRNFTPHNSTGEKVNIEEKLTYYLINDEVKIIHESSEKEFKDVLTTLRRLTKEGLTWKAWFEFNEQFAKVGYRYSTTVHKSQGGTFDTVFINMKDINKNPNIPERKRLWYTAITRAAKNIVFYNEKRFG